MQLYPLLMLVASMHLIGCASSSVMDLDANTVQISTSAAPVCGAQGAQQVATTRAAIETINRGYDRYVILGADAQNSVGVVGYTPVIANTYTNGNINAYGNTATYSGQSNTFVSGGQPIIAGSHDQALTIRMFGANDPQGANAVDARRVLGPDWQKIILKGPKGTC
jgi:hypothetical protein